MEIKCSNCSASISLEREIDFIVCPFCSSTLYLSYNATFKYLYFTPVITEKHSHSILLETLERIAIEETSEIKRKNIFFPFLQKGDFFQITPLFNPHPSFFSSFDLPAQSPIFFSEKIREWGEVLAINEETLLLSKDLEEKNLSILYIPFYEYTVDKSENKLIFYVEATSGKILYSPLPSSISKKQVKKVLSFIFIYFFLFSALSFFIKPPVLSFFITLIVSLTLSIFVVDFVMRKFD